MSTSKIGYSLILNVMYKDKFTQGFVDAMSARFADRDIRHIVYGSGAAVGYKEPTTQDVLSLDSSLAVLRSSESRALLSQADFIILNWANPYLLVGLRPYIKSSTPCFGAAICTTTWLKNAVLCIRFFAGQQ